MRTKAIGAIALTLLFGLAPGAMLVIAADAAENRPPDQRQHKPIKAIKRSSEPSQDTAERVGTTNGPTGAPHQGNPDTSSRGEPRTISIPKYVDKASPN